MNIYQTSIKQLENKYTAIIAQIEKAKNQRKKQLEKEAERIQQKIEVFKRGRNMLQAQRTYPHVYQWK